MRRVNPSKTTRSGARQLIRRNSHFIDQALEIAAILDAGDPTSREVHARRRSLRQRFGSKGRISVLEHLGRAIRSLSPLELEVFRSPRIGWKLIRTVAHQGVETAVVVRAFRDAIALPPRDGRRHRRSRSGLKVRPGMTFDAALAQENPIAYLAAELDAWQRSIGAPLRALVNKQSLQQLGGSRIPDVGQSLSMLMTSVLASRTGERGTIPPLSDDQALVLRMLKRIDDVQQTLEQTARMMPSPP